ncbi:6-bladed beta-propeller [Bacteroides sp. AN502(2024)]|uniref:6-bladed beta-propeller n=1 Tax=Bacteroides sp. AN502(2024) TaxID=3160599 RepID=UPI00351614A2
MFVLRIKPYYWIIGILLGFIFSCSGKTRLTHHAKSLVIDWDAVNIKDSFLYSTVFDSVQVIMLNNDSVLLGGIDRMQSYEDEMFVLDSQKAKGLFVFGKDGRFIRRIGNIGDAPGEYRDCSDFTINEHSEEAYIYDSHKKSIYVYSVKSGIYKRCIKIKEGNQIQRIYCVNNRLYAVNTYFYPLHDKDKYHILKQLNIDNGAVMAQWMDAEEYNKGWKDEFLHTNLFYPISGDRVLFSFGLSDSVMCLSQGKLYPFLGFYGKNTVKNADIKEQEKDAYVNPQMRADMKIDIHMRLGKQNKIIAIADIFEKDDILYLDCYSWQKKKLQCNLKTHEAYLFTNTVDDILYSICPKNHTLPSFLSSGENGVYYMVATDFLPELKYFASENNTISQKVKNRKVLKEINEESNPVILYYEYK